MPEQFLTQRHVLLDYECDMLRRVRPGTLLRLVQQISTDHCDSWGVTAQVYEQTHTAFLLAKLSLEITGDARIGDALTLTTRPAAPKRAIYHRFTTVAGENGAPVATVDARWVLVDTRTRRILLHVPDELHFPFHVDRVPEHKITLQKCDTAPVGSFSASYCRSDVNGHLNNAEYADIVCDVLPFDRMKSEPLRRMTLYYHRELLAGCSMDVEMGTLPDGGYYLCGRRGAERVFEGNAEF